MTLHRYEFFWLQIARSTVSSAVLYNLINESELLTSSNLLWVMAERVPGTRACDRPDDDKTNQYKTDNDPCMKK